MKRKWFFIIAIITGIILICFIIVLGTRQNIDNDQDRHVVVEDETIRRLEELLPGENAGEVSIKNVCGLFGDDLFNMIENRNYEDIYHMLNTDVLKKYRYVCDDRKKLDTYWDNLNNVMPDGAHMMLFDIMPSSLTKGGVSATYCIAGPIPDSADTQAYNYDGCLWLSITVYFDKQGEIVSMLPCLEASIESYVNIFGFRKGGMIE